MGKRTSPVWTDADLARLRRDFPNMRTADLAAALGRTYTSVAQAAYRLGLHKGPQFNATSKSGRFIKGTALSVATQFKPGQRPWNKGTHYVAGGRSAETRFRKGAVPANRQEVGALRINADGYLDIKVAPGPRRWVPLHRWNWKQAHGRSPPRGMALVFRDGDRMNCALENLELLTRRELIARNTIHNLPAELKRAIRTKAVLVRMINQRSPEHEQPHR